MVGIEKSNGEEVNIFYEQKFLLKPIVQLKQIPWRYKESEANAG